MQPAETCFWENTPNEIDLYKMSCRYTKMKKPNSKNQICLIVLGPIHVASNQKQMSKNYGRE